MEGQGVFRAGEELAVVELGCVVGDGGCGWTTKGLECQGKVSFCTQIRILLGKETWR